VEEEEEEEREALLWSQMSRSILHGRSI